MPARADVLPQLIAALRERKVPQRTIDLYTQHWHAAPEGSSDFPCPFCFAAGRIGTLKEQTKVGSFVNMRCSNCGDQVRIRSE